MTSILRLSKAGVPTLATSQPLLEGFVKLRTQGLLWTHCLTTPREGAWDTFFKKLLSSLFLTGSQRGKISMKNKAIQKKENQRS